LRTSDFEYSLPRERIAQEPAPRRDQARLLVMDRATGARSHRRITNLPELLAPGDLLVLNDARVDRARLLGRKETGGRLEALLLELRGAAGETEETWEAMLRASHPPGPGGRFSFDEGIEGEVLERLEGGTFLVRLTAPSRLEERRRRAGLLPLPPYIQRPEGPRPSDEDRYQTVYATRPGAVAAPTAGLHLTEELLDRLAERGVERATLTLLVGPGTFRPVKESDPRRHRMHEEAYELPEETAEAVARTRERGGRVVAVGTTVVRVLEAAAGDDGRLHGGRGRTSLFVLPGYAFRAVDVLLTNFHLPRSTLLMLVCAFGGREAVLEAYHKAVEMEYRFYSYGDAMLLR